MVEEPARRLWLGAVTLLALSLAACSSEPIMPSPESKFLQDQLIPRLVQWGKTRSNVFPLGPLLATQGFEKICTVAEYMHLAEFESEVPGIKSTHGSVGKAVPENRIAIIAIKGDAAHVAYVRTSVLTLRNKRPLCSGIENAVVRRLKPTQPSGLDSIPDVCLEEAGYRLPANGDGPQSPTRPNAKPIPPRSPRAYC